MAAAGVVVALVGKALDEYTLTSISERQLRSKVGHIGNHNCLYTWLLIGYNMNYLKGLMACRRYTPIVTSPMWTHTSAIALYHST